jgi:hypothetical protein
MQMSRQSKRRRRQVLLHHLGLQLPLLEDVRRFNCEPVCHKTLQPRTTSRNIRYNAPCGSGHRLRSIGISIMIQLRDHHLIHVTGERFLDAPDPVPLTLRRLQSWTNGFGGDGWGNCRSVHLFYQRSKTSKWNTPKTSSAVKKTNDNKRIQKNLAVNVVG